jgi:hypothetical protein
MTLAVERAGARAWSSSFYVWIAIGFALTVFLSFAPTYWAPVAAGQFHGNPIVHIHGMVFFAWTLFVVLQASLVANGQTALHRSIGLIGISLATAMVILGTLVTLNSLTTAEAVGVGARGETFVIAPLAGIVAFAVLIALAIANISRPEIHKRLMVLSMIAILDAPLGRPFMVFVFTGLPPGPPPLWALLPAYAVTDLFLAAALFHDWRTLGRPHPVYLIGGAAIVAEQLLRWPVSQTAGWHEFARAFASLGGAFPSGHG